MPIIYGNKSKQSESSTPDSGMDSADGMAKDNQSDQPSALLPKSIIGDKKVSVGDKIILEVVHIYEDEVEVQYPEKESKAEDEAEGGEEGESQMDKSQKELDSMAEE